MKFLDDPKFSEVRRRAELSALSKSDLDSMDMPSGVSSDDIWHLVQVLRRQVAIVSIVPTFPEDSFQYVWYALPRESQKGVESILEKLFKGSGIEECLRREEIVEASIHPIIEEVMAALEWDGKSSTYEHLRAVIKDENTPWCCEERLAKNYYRILLESFREQTGSIDCVDIYRQLVEGVETVNDLDQNKVAILQDFTEKAFQESDASKICYSAHFTEYTTRYDSFGQFSALTGSLIRRLFLIESGYPLLGLVSPFKAMLAKSNPKGLSDLCSRHVDSTGVSLDATGYYAAYIKTVELEVESLLVELEMTSTRRRAVLRQIKDSGRLNYRQKELLASFVNGSRKEVSVYDYRDDFQVAYSTARADLTALLKKNFITVSTLEGKTIIYRPCQKFEGVIENLLA